MNTQKKLYIPHFVIFLSLSNRIYICTIRLYRDFHFGYTTIHVFTQVYKTKNEN